MNYSAELTRDQRVELAKLLEESERRRHESALKRLQAAKALGADPTPALVADFAFLAMTDDRGRPIQPAPHHWLWLELLCNREIMKLLIKAPPESAKTTWLMAYLGCSIGFSPEWPRIIAAASGPVAKKRSLAIRSMIESPPFREIFPEVQPARTLSYENTEWSVAPHGQAHPGRIHPTLSAYGTGGAITGSRAAEALGDDVLDFENTRTAHQRNVVGEWLHNSFLSRRIARTGRAIMIGTAWHYDDTYSRLEADPTWTICHMPLLADGPDFYATIRYGASYHGPRLGEPVAGQGGE